MVPVATPWVVDLEDRAVLVVIPWALDLVDPVVVPVGQAAPVAMVSAEAQCRPRMTIILSIRPPCRSRE